MLFCVVSTRNDVQFCGIRIPLLSPSRGRGHLTIAKVERVIWVEMWVRWRSVKVKKKQKEKRLFRRITCSARTSKVTHYIRTAFWRYAVSDVSEGDRVLYFCSWLPIHIMWRPENHGSWGFFFEFTICKHVLFGRSIWPPHRAYVNEEFEHRTGCFKKFKCAGVSRVAQARWSIETLRSIGTLPRGTQRECTSKPLKHSIVERILVFKR